MSRPPRMTKSDYLGRTIPLSEDQFLAQIFSAAVLKKPGGVVMRKVSAVERKSSEAHLIAAAQRLGFEVARHGTHYFISVDPFKLALLT